MLTLAWIALATFVAFVVRGVSGFGSSLVGIGALSLLLPPAQVVPAFLALELVTSVGLLPSVWRDVDWRSLRWLVAGCVVATPFGLALLIALDPAPTRVVVFAALLAVSAFMLSPAARRVQSWPAPGPAGVFAVGCGTGVLNGLAGIGGPPAIVFYFATRTVAAGRASLIAFFVFTDAYALAWAGAGGLLQSSAWRLIALALPFALLGIAVGKRLYLRLQPATLLRMVWALLCGLGALGLATGLWQVTR